MSLRNRLESEKMGPEKQPGWRICQRSYYSNVNSLMPPVSDFCWSFAKSYTEHELERKIRRFGAIFRLFL
jgi:hypothetical protein